MSKSVPFELFPSKFKDIINLFDAIDKIYCFVVKRKLTCTISKTEKLYKETASGNNADSLPFSIDGILLICASSPGFCELLPFRDQFSLSGDNALFDLEIRFPTCSGTGSTNIKKRRKILLDALSLYIRDDFAKQMKVHNTQSGKHCTAELSDKELCKQLKLAESSGWPAFYDVNKCAYPEITTILKSLRDLYVESRLSKSVECNANSETKARNAGESTCTSTRSSSDVNNAVDAASIAECGGATAVFEYLQDQPFYRDQLKHIECIQAKVARYAELCPPALPALLSLRLQSVLGLQQLYLHQAKAIDALRQGKHVVVSTSTASGKSVIYNVPVLEAVLMDSAVTALYLFPTKVYRL